MNAMVNSMLRDEALVKMILKERSSNNNQLSEFEKEVIRRNIEHINGDTKIVFHSHNTLAINGYPTTVEEVLEYCREYKSNFDTNLEKIAEYACQNEKSIKEWNADRFKEQYSCATNPNDILKLVERERTISPGLSGYEKNCIDRLLNNKFPFSPAEESIISAICYEFENSGFPATRQEIVDYINERKFHKKTSKAATWVLVVFILLGVFISQLK